MPEWAQAILSIAGAVVGSYLAIRVELRFLWRDLAKLDARVAQLEVESPHPRRRRADALHLSR